MGIVIQQSIKASVFSYIGVIIGYVNVLWLYPYFLQADQIGLFRIIQSSAYLMATFGQFGMGSTLVKYFPQFKQEKGLLGLVLFIASVGYVALLLLCLLLREPIQNYFYEESPLFVEYFQIALIITYMVILFQVLEAYCRSILDISMPTLLRDIGIRLLTTATILLYGFDLISFELLVWAFAIIFAIVTGVLMIYLIRVKRINLSLSFSFIDRTILKQLLAFGLFAVLGAGGTQIILQIDSIMVSGELGLDETGIYTIAFFIGTVIELPKRAIAQLSMSLLAEHFKRQDMSAVKKLYQQTSINQLIIGALLLLGIWSNLDNVYAFVPNGELYREGFFVVLLIGLGKLSDMLFGANGEIIVMSKYYRFNVVAVLFLALVTIILNKILIPIRGIEGAALASFLAMFTFNLVKYVFVWMKFNIQPFNKQTLQTALIIALIYWGQRQLPSLSDPLYDLVVRSALISVVYMGLIYGLKVSPEVNGLIKRTIDSMDLFKKSS